MNCSSRGYPPECDCAHRAAPETEVVRSAADGSEPTTETHAPSADAADNPEEEANLEEALEIVKRVAEETDPSEWEEDESSGHKSNYSIWEIIRKQPRPVITEEHARIGAARFHEAVARQRLWDESDIRVPTRKDHNSYDDG